VVFEQIVQGVTATADVDPHRAAQRVVADRSRHRATGGLVDFEDATGIEGLAPIRSEFLEKVSIAIIEELSSLI
jgi:hypothetical protein